jgi:hypothetical protein
VLHPVFTPSTPESIANFPPMMPFTNTGLVLDRHNEDKLVTYALSRMGNIVTLNGGTLASGGVSYGYGGLQPGTGEAWLDKRQRATEMFQNNYAWRALQPDSIFTKSNKSMNTVRRIIKASAAQLADRLFGTEPFFQMVPQNDWGDAALAQNAQKFVSFKMQHAGVKAVARAGITGALVRGESVFKRGYRQSPLKWMSVDVCAHLDGVMLLDRDGQPVLKTDATVPHPGIPNCKMLARDTSVLLPVETQWISVRRPQSRVESFVDLDLLWFEDFLCDTTEQDIHGADFVGHMATLPYSYLYQMLQTGADPLRAKELLDMAKSSSALYAASNADRPNVHRGEQVPVAESMPKLSIAEFHMDIDADGDGHDEKVIMLVDVAHRRPIFYDYLQAAMPDHRRPFDVCRVFPVEHRWHGEGMYEGHRGFHDFIEILFNRLNLDGTTSGRIDFSNPQATREGRAGIPLKYGRGEPYTLEEGFTADDALTSKSVPSVGETQMNLFQICLQAIQLESGNITAGDGDLSGMPTTELATGIRSLEKQSAGILKDMLVSLIGNAPEQTLSKSGGMEAVMAGFAAWTIHYMEDEEVLLLEGPDGQQVLTLKRQDLINLQYRFKLLLSLEDDAQLVDKATKAKAVVAEYLQVRATTDAEGVKAFRNVAKQILRGFGFQDVDSMLPLPAAPAQPGMNPAAPPTDDTSSNTTPVGTASDAAAPGDGSAPAGQS